MARVVGIGQPANDIERQTIVYLRDKLPDGYTIIHNFEVVRDKQFFEVDMAILAPHCVYLVDVKGTSGNIEIDAQKWYPQGRMPFDNPLPKLRENAKILKSKLTEKYSLQNSDLKKVYIPAVILMAGKDVSINFIDKREEENIVPLNRCLAFFKDNSFLPGGMNRNIKPFLGSIESLIKGKTRPRSSLQFFGDWEIVENLADSNSYTEYRAVKRSVPVRLRVYHLEPLLDKENLLQAQKLLSNSFRVLAGLPGHPNIIQVKDFFEIEDHSSYVLVMEEASGEVLSQHLKKNWEKLTFSQKASWIKGILEGLAHAHKGGVIHRNLNPNCIIIDPEGNARIGGFDYARLTRSRASTVASAIVDEVDQQFMAPECFRSPSSATPRSDLFSAGLIFYNLLVGRPPFKDITELFDFKAAFPEPPTSKSDPDIPQMMTGWLEKLCAFEPEKRFTSAPEALTAFEELLKPPETHFLEKFSIPTVPEKPFYPDLPEGHFLNDQFVIKERLGRPGGFAVAYRVFDTFEETERVIKLILRDQVSVLERLRREYKTLRKLPEHPNVVKVIFAGPLPDGTPYLLMDYIDGFNVEAVAKDRLLSPQEAVTLAKQVASGLDHLHKNGIFHQDIKPSNLLWTDKGTRIIDFNLASPLEDEDEATGGTFQYLPPDLDLSGLQTPYLKADRDLYALGLTFYECLTGHYPFDIDLGPDKKTILDPRREPGCENLELGLAKLVQKWLNPIRIKRFASAQELLQALNDLEYPNLPEVTVNSPQARQDHSPTIGKELREIDTYTPPDVKLNPVKKNETITTDWYRTLGSERTLAPQLISRDDRPIYLGELLRLLKARRPGLVKTGSVPQNPYWSFSSGRSGFNYGWAFRPNGTLIVELYLGGSEAKRHLTELQRYATTIEAEIGQPLTWDMNEGKQACRVFTARFFSLTDSQTAHEQTKQWAIDTMVKFVDSFQRRI